jgi:hypothetical protein
MYQLHELAWSWHGSNQNARIPLRKGRLDIWLRKDGHYSVYQDAANDLTIRSWHHLSALTAQAIIYHLTSEGNGNAQDLRDQPPVHELLP